MGCVCAVTDKVPWSEFTPIVTLSAASAPTDVIENALRGAAIELARQTMLLQRDIYFDTQAGVNDYTICPNEGEALLSIRSVAVSGRSLTAVPTPEDAIASHNGFYFERPNRLILGQVPAEDAKEAGLARVAVVPSHDSCEVDRWVYDIYAEDIADGALSKLLLMKDAEWYSLTNAGVAQQRWRIALSRAKSAQAKGGVSGPMYMKTKRFI